MEHQRPDRFVNNNQAGTTDEGDAVAKIVSSSSCLVKTVEQSCSKSADESHERYHFVTITRINRPCRHMSSKITQLSCPSPCLVATSSVAQNRSLNHSHSSTVIRESSMYKSNLSPPLYVTLLLPNVFTN